MSKTHVHFMLEKYQLGHLVGEIISLSGGDINDSYLINTTTGEYILKIIDSVNYAKNYQVEKNELIYSLELSEKIARLMAESNIPAITALEHDKQPITIINNEILLIYPFIHAKPTAPQEINTHKIQEIAKILSKIHTLDLKYEPALKKWSLASDLVSKILEQKIWNYLLLANLSLSVNKLVYGLDEFIQSIYSSLKQDILTSSDLILTHNDLKPKNVLWADNKEFFIIDWEAAGYMPIATDYLDTMLSWCLESTDEKLILNPTKAKLFRESYGTEPQLIVIDAKSINITIAKWLVWLAFCINQIVKKGNVKDYLAFTIEALQMLAFLKENYGKLSF